MQHVEPCECIYKWKQTSDGVFANYTSLFAETLILKDFIFPAQLLNMVSKNSFRSSWEVKENLPICN